MIYMNNSGSILGISNLGSYFLVDIKLWVVSSYEDSLFTNFELRYFSLLSRWHVRHHPVVYIYIYICRHPEWCMDLATREESVHTT